MLQPVFVSYSKSDLNVALELVDLMETNGLGCWIAPRDITPSAEWAADIIEAITKARVMVLVYSRHSNESPQVRREVERAVHKRVPIVAYRIDEVLPEGSLEYFLSTQHWLDAFAGSREAHHERLLRCLKNTIEAAPATPGLGHLPQPSSTTSHPIERFAPEAVARIEGHLARYIGPIAKVLLRRAAVHANSLEELKEQVSHELDSERERRAFMDL